MRLQHGLRIGDSTVMPGDVVFGDREGVTFIRAHAVTASGLIKERDANIEKRPAKPPQD